MFLFPFCLHFQLPISHAGSTRGKIHGLKIKMAATKRLPETLKKDFLRCLTRRCYATANEKTTHFGFEEVTEDEKAEKGRTVW